MQDPVSSKNFYFYFCESLVIASFVLKFPQFSLSLQQGSFWGKIIRTLLNLLTGKTPRLVQESET